MSVKLTAFQWSVLGRLVAGDELESYGGAYRWLECPVDRWVGSRTVLALARAGYLDGTVGVDSGYLNSRVVESDAGRAAYREWEKRQ